MEEQIQLRVDGEASQPTLIYLPGLHGDWTLIPNFQRALANRVRFVVTTYPRTLTWSLDDYAAGVESALAEKGITRGWILAESFGSQVLWPMVGRGKFQIEGIILAGGFVKHPVRAGVRLAEGCLGGMPLRWLVWIMFTYARIARYRYRHLPETGASIREFIDRRSDKTDHQAMVYRLRLIAASDFRGVAKTTKIPIFAITGAIDPIVPWFWVRSWLRRHCPALREYKIIWPADHNILSTTPKASADQVVRWMNSAPPC
jgi:pimeloyl-ACP methyl ester carboxylesterase